MTVSQDVAILVVGLAMVVVVAWGSFVSVRSADRGPGWALAHLTLVQPMSLMLAGLGMLLAVLVRPLWAGLGVVYMGLALAVLVSMMRRNLLRLSEAGGFEDLDPDRRAELVGRARRYLLWGGVGLGIIGVVGLTLGAGIVGGLMVLLGVVLVGTGVFLSVAG